MITFPPFKEQDPISTYIPKSCYFSEEHVNEFLGIHVWRNKLIETGIRVKDKSKANLKSFIEEIFRARSPVFMPKATSPKAFINELLVNELLIKETIEKEIETSGTISNFLNRKFQHRREDEDKGNQAFFDTEFGFWFYRYFFSQRKSLSTIYHTFQNMFHVSMDVFSLRTISLVFDAASSLTFFFAHEDKPAMVNIVTSVKITGEKHLPNNTITDSFFSSEENQTPKIIEYLVLTKHGWQVSNIYILNDMLRQYLLGWASEQHDEFYAKYNIPIYRVIHFIMNTFDSSREQFQQKHFVCVGLQNIMTNITTIYIDGKNEEKIEKWRDWLCYIFAEFKIDACDNQTWIEICLNTLGPNYAFTEVKNHLINSDRLKEKNKELHNLLISYKPQSELHKFRQAQMGFSGFN